MDKWIEYRKHRPEHDKLVLTCDTIGNMQVLFFDRNKFDKQECPWYLYVHPAKSCREIHSNIRWWMELPHAPE
jgi:hypothetical protein